MSDLNQLGLSGHIVRNAQVEKKGEKDLVSFPIACNYVWKDLKGTVVSRVDFFFIKLWGEHAVNLASYLTKGRAVTIEGRLCQRRWVDKDTNEVRSRLEISTKRVNLIGPGSGKAGEDGFSGKTVDVDGLAAAAAADEGSGEPFDTPPADGSDYQGNAGEAFPDGASVGSAGEAS